MLGPQYVLDDHPSYAIKSKKNFYLTAVAFVVLVLIISQTAFSKGVPTCNNFLGNVYLYLLAAFVLLALFLEGFNNYKLKIASGTAFWGGFIGSLVMIVIVFLYGTNPENVLRNHLLVIGLMLMMALFLYPFYKEVMKSREKVFRDAFLITASLFVLLTILSYTKPEWFSMGDYPKLVFALLALIILELVFFFILKPTRKRVLLLTMVGAFLFSLFILYDTKKLIIQSQNCVVPNYPVEIMDLFYDLINLFLNISAMRS